MDRVFFFQAEDGIRDYKVTGVQTCALPISLRLPPSSSPCGPMAATFTDRCVMAPWALSPSKLKPGNFQLVGMRHLYAGLKNSTPLSSPSELWKQRRIHGANGPRKSSNGGPFLSHL